MKSGTGSAAPKNPRYKFQIYSRMLNFLDNVQKERKGVTNVGDNNSQTLQQDEYSAQGSQEDDIFNTPQSESDRQTTDNSSHIDNTPSSPDGRPLPPPPPPPSSQEPPKKKDQTKFYQKER